VCCRKNEDEVSTIKPVNMTEFAEADTSRGTGAIFARSPMQGTGGYYNTK